MSYKIATWQKKLRISLYSFFFVLVYRRLLFLFDNLMVSIVWYRCMYDISATCSVKILRHYFSLSWIIVMDDGNSPKCSNRAIRCGLISWGRISLYDPKVQQPRSCVAKPRKRHVFRTRVSPYYLSLNLSSRIVPGPIVYKYTDPVLARESGPPH